MANNEPDSYAGFYQTHAGFASSQYGQPTACTSDGSYSSAAQPAYYSAIDKAYSVQNTQLNQPSFGYEYSTGYSDQGYAPTSQHQAYNQTNAAIGQAAYGTLQDGSTGTTTTTPSAADYYSQQQPVESSTSYGQQQQQQQQQYASSYSETPIFGIDFSDEHQRKQMEQFQQCFQQAFEQQLAQQIQLQLQQQSVFGVDVGSSGNLGASVVDGVAVFFGDDSVGKRRNAGDYGDGGSGYGGYKRKGDGYDRMRMGETYPNPSSRSSGGQQPSSSSSKNSKYYCSTCDVSYANSLAFTSHLGSKDHKMQREKEVKNPKPAQPASYSSLSPSSQPASAASSSLLSSSKKDIVCQLCNITCTGADTYAQHIKTDEHQKMLRMASENRKKTSDARNNPPMPLPEEFGTNMNTNNEKGYPDNSDPDAPVGLEFVEEIRNHHGDIIRVVCNLCRFEIPNPEVRRQHGKSQQHRMNYEQKMAREGQSFGQDFQSLYNNNLFGNNQQHLGSRGPEFPFGNLANIFGSGGVDFASLFGQALAQQRSFVGGFAPPSFGVDPSFRRSYEQDDRSYMQEEIPETEDDLCVKRRHSLIYPTADDFKAVQKISGDCDKWLKAIMNNLMDSSQKKLLTGVSKIGSLAKGLLLHGDLTCDLLVIAQDWPTKTLVGSILRELKILMEKNCKENDCSIKLSESGDSIVLQGATPPYVKCVVGVTSHCVKDAVSQSDLSSGSDDRLGTDTCLRLLDSLEQTKWFQTKAIPLPSCVLLVRVLKSLCQEITELRPLTNEAIEFLVERAIDSLEGIGGPGAIFRRVLETLSSSLLLGHEIKNEGERASSSPDGDKIGKETNTEEGSGNENEAENADRIKVFDDLTNQEREDITRTAQHLLRLASFGKLRQILNHVERKDDEQKDGKDGDNEPESGDANNSSGNPNNKDSKIVTANNTIQDNDDEHKICDDRDNYGVGKHKSDEDCDDIGFIPLTKRVKRSNT